MAPKWGDAMKFALFSDKTSVHFFRKHLNHRVPCRSEIIKEVFSAKKLTWTQKAEIYKKCCHTSSGTGLIVVKPFLNVRNTRFAPHRRADVAQSKAVSPAPSTITFPWSSGNLALQAHIPATKFVKQCSSTIANKTGASYLMYGRPHSIVYRIMK